MKDQDSSFAPSGRVESIDVLRGFDMFFIIGFSSLVINLCVALGFGAKCWLAKQMVHPPWIGLVHHDTIFPLFLFIAGLSFPFSLAKQVACGRSRAKIALRVLRRLVTLVVLGMVFEKYFSGEEFRFGSVLCRIGIAWAVAAWLFMSAGVRVRAAVAVAALLGYWALNLFVSAPDNPGAGVFTPQGNIVCWVDRVVLGRIGRVVPGMFENQGLLANIPSVVTAMLGMFTGEFVMRTRGRVSGDRQAGIMLAAAAALAAAGCVVAFGCGPWSFPISKPLWSTSFTLVVGGYSVAMFAIFYWLVDVRRVWRRTLFFRVIGLNAITVYLAQRVLDVSYTNKMLFGRLAALFPAEWRAVVLGVTYIAICWGLLYFLHRKKTYLKV